MRWKDPLGIGNVAGGGYKPPNLNELQSQNRQKARRFHPKKKFNNRFAPFAPRNTTLFIIKVKKSGRIASLVSLCPVMPAVLPTPIFSSSREVLVDTVKEEWGVDGYYASLGIRVEEAREEVFEISRHQFGAPKLTVVDFSIHHHEVPIVERKVTGVQYVRYDTARPDVNLRTIVAFLRKDFRCHVGKRAAESVEESIGPDLVLHGAKFKVSDLDLRRATVPGRKWWGFFTPPVAGADFRAAFVASCFFGALPPMDL